MSSDLFYGSVRYFSYLFFGIYLILFVRTRIKRTWEARVRGSIGIVSLSVALVALLLAVLFASVKGCDGEGNEKRSDSSGKGANLSGKGSAQNKGGSGSSVPLKIEMHRVPNGGFIEIYHGADDEKIIRLEADWENLLKTIMASYTNRGDMSVQLQSESSVPLAARGMVIDLMESMGFLIMEVDE